MSLELASTSTNRLDVAAAASINTMPVFTVLMRFYHRAQNNNQTYTRKGSAAAIGWQLASIGTAGNFRTRVGLAVTPSDLITNTNPLAVTGKWYDVALVWAGAGTAGHIYVGDLVTPLTEAGYSTNSAGSGTQVDDSAVSLGVGNIPNGVNTFSLNGNLGHMLLIARNLTLGELRYLQGNPQLVPKTVLFIPEFGREGIRVQRDISGNNNHATIIGTTVIPGIKMPLGQFPVPPMWMASSGTAYTITASVASFVLTGVAAGLRAAKLMPAAVGSFALAGQTALLKRGYPVLAGTGAFALSGQAAQFKIDRRITGGLGSFVYTGIGANLLYGRLMPAVATAFALTGQAANLLYGRKVVTTVGAFSLSGQAANLLWKRSMPAGTGAFTLSGQVARLLKGYSVVSSTGTFVLSGQIVDLIYSGGAKVLSAIVANYALTGQTVNLKAGRRIPISVGSFALSGQPNTMSIGRRVITTVGAFTLSGQAALFSLQRRIAAVVANFILSGQAANLKATHILPAGTGSFAYNGQAAALKIGKKVFANAGSFAFTGNDATLIQLRKLLTQVGAFALVGQDTVLTFRTGRLGILEIDTWLIPDDQATWLVPDDRDTWLIPD